MSHKFIKLFATFFYIGELPFAPGTIASAAGTFFWLIFYKNPYLYLILFSVITFIGFQVSGLMESMLNKKDPGCIVIDEISGVMISFFLLPVSLSTVIVTFFLFRAFDMFKIYPGNFMESKGGSFGIMMDDIVAGIYTNIVMHIALKLSAAV